jgi:hypothetical protein
MDDDDRRRRRVTKGSDTARPHRREPRTAVRHDVSEYLWTADGATSIKCLSVDVSPQGLGVVGFHPFEKFMPLTLKINGKSIALVVTWVRRDPTRESIFHAGLKAVEAGENLFKEFRRAGVLGG